MVCLPVGGGGVGVEVDRHHVARPQLGYDHLDNVNFIFWKFKCVYRNEFKRILFSLILVSIEVMIM